MTDESFVRWYRVAVLGGAFAWRLVLFNPLRARGVYDAIEGLVYGVGLSLLPPAALAALAGRRCARWALVAAALAVFGVDSSALALAHWSSSSTAAVALMLAPLVEFVTVVPAAALLGRLARPGPHLRSAHRH